MEARCCGRQDLVDGGPLVAVRRGEAWPAWSAVSAIRVRQRAPQGAAFTRDVDPSISWRCEPIMGAFYAAKTQTYPMAAAVVVVVVVVDQRTQGREKDT